MGDQLMHLNSQLPISIEAIGAFWAGFHEHSPPGRERQSTGQHVSRLLSAARDPAIPATTFMSLWLTYELIPANRTLRVTHQARRA